MKLLLAALVLTCSAAASAQVKDAAEPNVQRTVIQDDGARIEELRVRGQVQRIVVKPKNAAEYEVVAPAGGRDPSQNRANQQAGAGGQRVWNLLRF
jgi:opacity protein-like surface antigen